MRKLGKVHIHCEFRKKVGPAVLSSSFPFFLSSSFATYVFSFSPSQFSLRQQENPKLPSICCKPSVFLPHAAFVFLSTNKRSRRRLPHVIVMMSNCVAIVFSLVQIMYLLVAKSPIFVRGSMPTPRWSSS